MQEEIMKQRIINYVEEIISPMQVEQAVLVEETEKGAIWLVESDTGHEYWVVGDHELMNIFSKSGLLCTPQRAMQAFLTQQDKEIVEVADRFDLI